LPAAYQTSGLVVTLVAGLMLRLHKHYALNMHDPLLIPATPARIRRLHAAGVLSSEQLASAMRLAVASPQPAAWVRFLSALLLIVGGALTISGTLYFFAYNWDELGRFHRLGLAAGWILLTAVGAWRMGLEALSGRVCLMAASVGVGILLLVYGQTYQTGADDWELYAYWAGLIIPWVLASRMPTLWLLMLGLVNLACTLWRFQTFGKLDLVETLWIPVSLALLNGLAWLGWEALGPARSWMQVRWMPRLLLVMTLLMLCGPSVFWVLEPAEVGLSGLVALLLLAFVSAVLGVRSWRGGLDLFLPTAAVGAVLLVLDCFVWRVLFEHLNLEEVGFLLLALILIGQAAVAVKGLTRLQQRQPEEALS